MQAALVDAARAARRHRDTRGRSEHERIEELARFDVVCLRVVQVAKRPHLARRQTLVVEQHSRGDERAREAAAPGLVGSSDEPATERPVEPKQAAGGGWLFLRGGRRF